MKISVVICTYKPQSYGCLNDSIESVLKQTYESVELVVVVDGNKHLYDCLRSDYDSVENIILHCNEENKGLSESRNVGIKLSTGDVVAFLDDDAVAHDDWIAQIIDVYNRRDALAVGGKLIPQWVAGKPHYLPQEFYWLIGVTYRGFPTEECEVRNTFGSNISFRRSVFESVGGFDTDLGRYGDRQIQGEETELAARMNDTFGEQVWYNPDAVVEHKVFSYRTESVWLIKRAFWQGYSKYVLDKIIDYSGGEESDFLTQLCFEGLPRYGRQTIRNRSKSSLMKGLFAIVLTISVGAGYLYGLLSVAGLNRSG
jgi:glycosyltransferase involved in cell wall biosynthesis